MQKKEFLKKFFILHRTNYLYKQIITFHQRDNETFFDYLDRFKDLLFSCLHHDFEIWRSVSSFYQRLNTTTKQFIETMCDVEFLSKDADKI